MQVRLRIGLQLYRRMSTQREAVKPKPRRGKSNDMTRISRSMTRVLRHDPPADMDASGWVPVPSLLENLKARLSMEDIEAIVSRDEKGRFEIDRQLDPPRIRATQGHSIQLGQPVITPVVKREDVPFAVHVTSCEAWKAIQADGYLRRMGRSHIHFATKAVLARKNSWAKTFLQLNVEAALADGFELSLSSNGVLLCEGPLPIQYVTVIDNIEMAASSSV